MTDIIHQVSQHPLVVQQEHTGSKLIDIQNQVDARINEIEFLVDNLIVENDTMRKAVKKAIGLLARVREDVKQANEAKEQLEHQNQEMLEVLKEAHDYLFPKQGSCLKPLPSFAETEAIKVKLKSIIAKAEAA